MTNREFWNLINESCRLAGMDNNKYLEVLNNKLSKLDAEDGYQFNYYVGYYSGKAEENPKLALLMKVIEGSVTDDSLLYFAVWLVSRGENIYFETLKNPDKFITLINPETLSEFGGHYYAPEFELLMYTGRNEEEYDVEGEIPEQEYKLINKIYSEKIPEDNRNYYDLVRDIDKILPKTMKFFDFDKELLEESLKYEEMEKNNFSKIKNEEEEFLNELKKQWTFTELKKTIYELERTKRSVPVAVPMPPYNDSIIMYTTGLNKAKDGFIIKKCYWHNYKTGENKDIKNTGSGEYLAGDDKNIYFYSGNFEESPKISVYNFESNEFSSTDIIDNDFDNNKTAAVITMIGKGKNKSGVIHNGKLYFSLIIYANPRTHHIFKFYKEKSYVYDITENQISLLRENISKIRFYQDKMYYLELGDHADDYTYYYSPKTLICRDMKNNREEKIAENVSDYALDNGVVYYSHIKGEKIHDLIRVENGSSDIILKNQMYLDDFTAAGNNIFLSFYLSTGNGGYIHSFILNIKTGSICEVAGSSQPHESIVYEDKYTAVENIYDDRKIFLKIYEYEMAEK